MICVKNPLYQTFLSWFYHIHHRRQKENGSKTQMGVRGATEISIGRNRWCEEIGDSGVVWKNQRVVFCKFDIHMGCLNMFRLGLEIGLLILETILQPRLPRSVFSWRWPGTLRLIIKPSTWEVGRVKRGFSCLSAAAGSLAAWGCFGSCACG